MHSVTKLAMYHKCQSPRQPVIHHSTIHMVLPCGYHPCIRLDSAKRLLPHLTGVNAKVLMYEMNDDIDIILATMYITNFNDTYVLDMIGAMFPQLALVIKSSGPKSIVPLNTSRIHLMSGPDYVAACKSPSPIDYDSLEKIVKASGIPAEKFVKNWRHIGWPANLPGLRKLGVPLNVLMPLIKRAPYVIRSECLSLLCDEIAMHNEKNTMLSELWGVE
jgi:hypothetical protein